MQDLRNLVARLAAKPPAGTSGSTTQSQIRELAINTDTQLKALEARAKRHTDTRVAALATDVDKALKKQAAEVNAALQGGSGRGSTTGGSGGTSGGTGTGSTTTTPPADVPRTGITYTLKRGDLISSIAAKNKSRVAWILAANNLTEAQAKRLQIGHKLFIPQRQNTPPTPPTDGTPPPPPPAE
jgi:LysM repeat protein